MENRLELTPLEPLGEAAECLKVLGHPARLRMVEILMQGRFPVREIAELCELPPHQTCEHLRMLKGHGLLGSHRRGREVFYEIADPRLPQLIQCIRTACEQ
ncbi:MAG: metalloregulator ArsR/SmtB family transcription factor [Planctomycetota bacterium]